MFKLLFVYFTENYKEKLFETLHCFYAYKMSKL